MRPWQSVVVAADDYYVQVARVMVGRDESHTAAGILRMSIRERETERERVFVFTEDKGAQSTVMAMNNENKK